MTIEQIMISYLGGIYLDVSVFKYEEKYYIRQHVSEWLYDVEDGNKLTNEEILEDSTEITKALYDELIKMNDIEFKRIVNKPII